MKSTSTLLLLFFCGCFSLQTFINHAMAQKDTMVLISTEFGNIKLRLYNETPLHRSNFVKLVKKQFYDSLLFHRVIQDFMIQGGDPESKHARPGANLGEGDVGYTIPAEIVPKFYHKRGALAAARQGDEVNPTKASSGCQFYIVHGRKFNDADLTSYEERTNQMTKQQIFTSLISKHENEIIRNQFIKFQQAGNNDSLQTLTKKIEPMIQKEFAKTIPFKFSEQQRKDYINVGGAPHLDGGYTVFGEVVEGLEIVDKIATQPVNQNSRPNSDLRMKMELLK